MIIDTHVHLDDARYKNDIDNVLKRSIEHDVRKWIIPGADPKTLQRAITLSEKYEDIYFSVGVHPYDASAYNPKYFEQFLKHEKCVAVGECGLDYYRLPEEKKEISFYKNLQKEIFIDQINLANKYKLPMIIHIRDASLDSFEVLMHSKPEKGGVLHCYNADEQLLKLSEFGFYFGVGGVITFHNAKKLVNILPKISLEKLLLETDAPYLTPVPFRGKRNEPAYTHYIAQKISDLLGIKYTQLCEITTQNAQRLFF
ncbi:MAG: TatD family hydrolase [Campylobacterales bacterium]|nr:TatD family hydrolase [Campylobacterales bacterium]